MHCIMPFAIISVTFTEMVMSNTNGAFLMTKLNTSWCQVQRCERVEKKFD